jgi:hypothetical protein
MNLRASVFGAAMIALGGSALLAMQAEKPKVRAAAHSEILPDEARLYTQAAETAWLYVERNYEPATGLIDATSGYAYTTVWDMASSLAVLYTGHELKLLNASEYDVRMRRLLRTMQTMDLFDNAGFNKVYSTRTAAMIDRDQKATKKGYGWSAIDAGRLLVWLKIVAVNQPKYQDDAAAIVRRLDMKRIIKDGYMWGEDKDDAGLPRVYQEGQTGYEQYAARGFALWGVTPQRR